MNSTAKSFPASPNSLKPARDNLSNRCEQIGVGKKKTYRLCVAINGIAGDIINYGHPQTGVESNIIKVLMTNESKQLTVTSMVTTGAFKLFSYGVPDEEEISKRQMLTGLPASGWNIKTVISSRFTLILNNWYC